MRHSPCTAVYDACVLYPAPLRDLLMWLAQSGLYRAKWTEQIHEEWKRNLLLNRQDLARAQLDKISALMERAVPDALVVGYENICTGVVLPDPDDLHVLAAAVRCKAGVIVTFNLKDFPQNVLDGFDIEAQHPDEFVMDLWDLDQAAVLGAASKMRKSLKNPPLSVDEFLDCIYRQGLPQTAAALRQFSLLL